MEGKLYDCMSSQKWEIKTKILICTIFDKWQGRNGERLLRWIFQLQFSLLQAFNFIQWPQLSNIALIWPFHVMMSLDSK